MSIEFDLIIESEHWGEQKHWANLIDQTLEIALKSLPSDDQLSDQLEIAVCLSDNSTVKELNNRFRGKDKATNVLSFPSGDEPTGGIPYFLGDLILAYETTRDEARTKHIDLETHTRHLIIHGFLHLLGYDHIENKEAEEMESIEIRILSKMGIDDPYADA